MSRLSSLPYRNCVGIALLNSDNKVWIGKRIPAKHDSSGSSWWQMPQGGIDDGESPERAALRELQEETGVHNVEILAETENWLTYDLPEDLIGIALKGKYKGQKQKWFAMRFVGTESEININPDKEHKAEFSEWRWADLTELPELIVPFKKRVYEQVITEFSRFVR